MGQFAWRRAWTPLVCTRVQQHPHHQHQPPTPQPRAVLRTYHQPPSPQAAVAPAPAPAPSPSPSPSPQLRASSEGVGADEHLYVVLPHFNPARYSRRRALAIKTAAALAANNPGVRLVVAECASSPREFELDDASVPDAFLCVRVVAPDVMWRKENLINIAVSQLPSTWRYVAWIDADITFVRDDWAAATVRALRTFDVVQMFRFAASLDCVGNVMVVDHGFAAGIHDGQGVGSGAPEYASSPGHPGFAWAATRDAWTRTRGLLDNACPLGGADRVMALAWAGLLENSSQDGGGSPMVPVGTARASALFHTRAAGVRMGHVDGTVLHAWHGRLSDRGYNSRWSSLCEARFDPATDIARDSRGVLHWTAAGRRLHALAEAFFRARRDDGE